MVFEKALKSPFECKVIKPIKHKENKPWIFFGRTDAETEASILWPPDVKSLLIEKDPYAGKDWRQEEKGTTQDKMVGWHHWLNGHKFELTLGDVKDREDWCAGRLACRKILCPSGCKESDTTKWLKRQI